jgi:hypothetical protein
MNVVVDARKLGVIWRIRLLYSGRLAAIDERRWVGAGIFSGILVGKRGRLDGAG